MRKSSAVRIAAAVGAATALSLSACSSGGSSDSGQTSSSGTKASDVTLNAVLWDPGQVPSYQACADAFKTKTGITVNLAQSAWGQYWNDLTTQLAAGQGPDVITNHVGYYPQLVENDELLDLTPYFKADGYDMDGSGITTNGLWAKDGKQYGISQDRDAVQLIYNTADVDASAVSGLTWNPTDGGSFGALVKHLTVDDKGVRGDEAGFDKSHVKTYGFAMEASDGIAGQSSWATFALDMGWYWTTPDEPFATQYNMDDPKLAQVFTWIQSMYNGGYFAPIARVTSLGITPVLDTHLAATSFQGAWTISSYAPSADKNQKYAWASLPTGPNGTTMTISNSLAQSVLSVSKHPAEAAKWVEFVGSTDCQDLVAQKAVVFPSIPSEADKVQAADQANGIDVSSFVKVLGTSSNLVNWPITDNGTQINTLATNAFDNQLLRGTGDPTSVLKKLNDDINALFK